MWVLVGQEIRVPESTMGGKNHSQSQIQNPGTYKDEN